MSCKRFSLFGMVLIIGLVAPAHGATIQQAQQAYEDGNYEQALTQLAAVDKAHGRNPRAESIRVLSLDALGRTREAYLSALAYERLTSGMKLGDNEAHAAIIELKGELRQQVVEDRKRKQESMQRERLEDAESVLNAVVANAENQQQVREGASQRREYEKWIAPLRIVNEIISANSGVYYKYVVDNGDCPNWAYHEEQFVYSHEPFKLEKLTMHAKFDMTWNESQKYKVGCEEWDSEWVRGANWWQEVNFADLIKAEWKEYKSVPEHWANPDKERDVGVARFTDKAEGVGLLILTFNEGALKSRYKLERNYRLPLQSDWGKLSLIRLVLASSRGNIDKLIEAFNELREMALERARHR